MEESVERESGQPTGTQKQRLHSSDQQYQIDNLLMGAAKYDLPRLAAEVSVLVAFMALSSAVEAFSPGDQIRREFACAGSRLRSRRSTKLYDINEWRDIMFDFDIESDLSLSAGTSSLAAESPPREVCVLPFPFDEVLLQGETKELRLYEDRFVTLFEDTMDNYGGVVAMGLLADSGIIQSAAICEIEAFNRMEEFGIFATIRVVGRSSLVDVTQETPYIKAVVSEILDEVPDNLDLCDTIAGNIENTLITLSSMEHRLIQVELDQEIFDDNENDGDDDDDDDDGDNDDDDDDDENDDMDRTARFNRAFKITRATDSQGYTVADSSSGDEPQRRSVQDLAAISWAAFQTDPPPSTDVNDDAWIVENGQLLAETDTLYRLQALSSTNLFERLKLASHMLREEKQELKKCLEAVGVEFNDGDSMELD